MAEKGSDPIPWGRHKALAAKRNGLRLFTIKQLPDFYRIWATAVEQWTWLELDHPFMTIDPYFKGCAISTYGRVAKVTVCPKTNKVTLEPLKTFPNRSHSVAAYIVEKVYENKRMKAAHLVHHTLPIALHVFEHFVHRKWGPKRNGKQCKRKTPKIVYLDGNFQNCKVDNLGVMVRYRWYKSWMRAIQMWSTNRPETQISYPVGPKILDWTEMKFAQLPWVTYFQHFNELQSKKRRAAHKMRAAQKRLKKPLASQKSHDILK